jgi:hypothetical protein
VSFRQTRKISMRRASYCGTRKKRPVDDSADGLQALIPYLGIEHDRKCRVRMFFWVPNQTNGLQDRRLGYPRTEDGRCVKGANTHRRRRERQTVRFTHSTVCRW